MTFRKLHEAHSLGMKVKKTERNSRVLSGRKSELIGLIRQAKRDGLEVLIAGYKRELDVIDHCYKAIREFGGSVKPCRTPWKRMSGRNEFFEEL